LPGALDGRQRAELLAELTARLGDAQAARWWSVYGGAAAEVAALAAQPELRAPLVPGGAVLAAELVHAVEREWAVTLEDILQRRCMAGLDADFGLTSAPAAAAALARLGLWSAAEAERQLAAYRAFAARHVGRPPG
jgi:glycerol-3-phosphate dehydrogenase